MKIIKCKIEEIRRMKSLLNEKLYKYIDTADEKLLKLMYAVAIEYSEASEYELTDARLLHWIEEGK